MTCFRCIGGRFSYVPDPFILRPEMFSGVRQAMTIRKISHPFQSVLPLPCEPAAGLTVAVQPGRVRGKRFAVRIARKPAFSKTMASIHDLESQRPDTVVITSAATLKAAFQQWADEREQARRAEERNALLDEAAARKRLGKSHATLWRWNKSGFLACHKVGGKNCYRLADIERIEGGNKG